jgi:hypothetical protein
MPESKGKTYIVRAEGKNKLTGTREFLESTIATLGLPYRWSNTRKDFILIVDMHSNHLLNTIKEEVQLCGNNEDFLFLMSGPLVAEFNKRAVKA